MTDDELEAIERNVATCKVILTGLENELRHVRVMQKYTGVHTDEVEQLRDELETFRLGKHHQENAQLRWLLREARTTIERLADQQAMTDDFYKPTLAAIDAELNKE